MLVFGGGTDLRQQCSVAAASLLLLPGLKKVLEPNSSVGLAVRR
jgi:hypothetical protein